MNAVGRFVVFLTLLWASTPPAAASSIADSMAADSAAAPTEYFQSAGPLARLHLEPYGDVRLWAERVQDRPGAPKTLERQRATVRTGMGWRPPTSPLEARAGVRASLGSDRNAESRAAFDNEIADTVEVDELAVRVATASGDALTLGKMRSPLDFTELLWDADLRPVGFAFGLSLARAGIPGARIAGGAFTRSRFSSDDAWVAAGQVAMGRASSSGRRVDAVVSYLEPRNLDPLPSRGFARQNATVARPGGRDYAARFRTLDLQLATALRWGRVPITLRVEGARNLAVTRESDAARVRLTLGGLEAPAGLELGWLHQRIEREAWVGAFNSDDWWFHTRSRGNLGWAAIGVGRPVTLRVSGFLERRDDLSKDTRRWRAELIARLPTP